MRSPAGGRTTVGGMSLPFTSDPPVWCACGHHRRAHFANDDACVDCPCKTFEADGGQ
jgi:hypothetical protein